MSSVLLAACAGQGAEVPSSSVLGNTEASRLLLTSRGMDAAYGEAKSRRSWIDKDAKKGSLLYVSIPGCPLGFYGNCYAILIYTWPARRLVGNISLYRGGPSGMCVDAKGSVWVTASGLQLVYKFPHGSVKPSEALPTGYSYIPVGCAIDPKTGDLAVADECSGTNCSVQGAVEVFPRAKQRGSHTYASSTVYWPYYCSYDGSGNLFFDGLQEAGYEFALGELPFGGKATQAVILNKAVGYPGGVQWDGQYLAIGDQDSYPQQVYRFDIAGTTGSYKGSVKLDGPSDVGGFYIASSMLFGATGTEDVESWKYPHGGAEVKTLNVDGFPADVVLSPAVAH